MSVNPNIFLALALLFISAFIIFYAYGDYRVKKDMVELLEDISNYLRNIELELKKKG